MRPAPREGGGGRGGPVVEGTASLIVFPPAGQVVEDVISLQTKRTSAVKQLLTDAFLHNSKPFLIDVDQGE